MGKPHRRAAPPKPHPGPPPRGGWLRGETGRRKAPMELYPAHTSRVATCRDSPLANRFNPSEGATDRRIDKPRGGRYHIFWVTAGNDNSL